MLKKIAFAAFATVSVAAMAQSGMNNNNNQSGTWNNNNNNGQSMRWSDRDADWNSKYNTYAIGTADTSNLSVMDDYRILHHELKSIPSVKAYVITDFLSRLPGDQEAVLLKGLVNNYKQASIVRDEVAMARFGPDQTYAWLSYPPLTWGSNPGENSWASINPSSITVVTYNDNGWTDSNIAMTDDQSRPMRMVIAHRGWHEISYDDALDILGSGLSHNEQGVLHTTFQPMIWKPSTYNSVGSYTNEEALDAIICLIEANAKMTQNLDRFAWYNHFDKNYYRMHNDW
jgi:hypothetical protein